jgi:membrane-associated phospholipid phosphatase
LMTSGAQFRAGPPPAPDSAAFRAALAEVRRLSDTRTPEQERLAAVWADGLGSYAPAGRWNKNAADLAVKYQLGEAHTARMFALLNMALMDAGIAAWETKYHYQCARPREVDPQITTPVEEPNSPSFTCSHAAFSGAGAAVLAHLFPAEADLLRARAQEAAMSRVYGGIQFRFEGEAGLTQGRAVAGLAIQRAQRE